MNLEAAPASENPVPDNVFAVEVRQVEHFTDRLFSFRVSRPASLRFRSGEFVMLTLPSMPKPVYRAYSIASPSWDEELEFYSIKVEDGPLTQHLKTIQPGDTIWLRKKTTGTLVLDALTPGKRLWMISTGTGIAPFASLIRDPESYERFDQLILTQTCREENELSYGRSLVANAKADPLVGEMVTEKLTHFESLTQQAFENEGRITTLLESGAAFEKLGVPPINPAEDRVMICGSAAMLSDVKAYCDSTGLIEGSNSRPAEYVIERAFVG